MKISPRETTEISLSMKKIHAKINLAQLVFSKIILLKVTFLSFVNKKERNIFCDFNTYKQQQKYC